MSDSKNTVVVSRAEQLWDFATRRDFLRVAGMGGAVVLLPSLFAACNNDDDNGNGLTDPNRNAGSTVTLDLRSDIGIFNFLFLFEQTEVAYYNAAVASSAFSSMTAEQQEVIGDLRSVEIVHREFLRSLLGSNGVGNAAFNMTAINAAAATGALILRTAEMLEDTGVATQIGLGKYIQSVDYLGIAGKINSVEARHVAAIRDIREAAGIAPTGAAGTRFAGDDIVVPTGTYAGLNAKIEYVDALARVSATGFVSTSIQVSNAPAAKTGTPDFGPTQPHSVSNTPMTIKNEDTILSAIDPDIMSRIISRREALTRGASLGSVVTAGLALGSIPVAIAALARPALGQTLPTNITDVLNFALMLEIFENEFYKAVLGTSAVATQNAAFATVRVAAAAVPGAVAALQQIQKHEAQHVAFLLANGATNVLSLTAASFDFTGNRSALGGGPFAAAGTSLPFLLAVAQGAEDTGVRAYKGQAGALQTDPVRLEAALRIHAVEARHASKIRRMRRATGAPSTVRYAGYIQGTGVAAAGVSNLTNVPAAVSSAFDAIYANDAATTQGGVNLTTLSNIPSNVDLTNAASMAFDEPLTKPAVVAIVQPFFIPTIPG